VGEPDFDTPSFIREAGVAAIKSGFTRYTNSDGMPELKDAIIGKFQRDNELTYQRNQILISTGAKQTLFNLCMAVLDAGDEVIIPAPYWVTYPEIVKFLRANPVIIETEANDFVLTAEMVRHTITPKSKLIILNSPSNPSGRIIPPDEFRKIVEVCAEHDIWIISDECYLYFAYPPATPFTAGTLPEELRSRVMISGSFSKSHAMTGWRIGYALGREEWINAMLKIQSHSTSNASSISQRAAIEAATGETDSLKFMLSEYQKRRDWLVPALNAIEGIHCAMPEGAFYVFPSVKGLLGGRSKTSGDFAKLLVDEAHVIVTDGAAFGSEGYIRISYANSLENIQKAVAHIAEVAKRG